MMMRKWVIQVAFAFLTLSQTQLTLGDMTETQPLSFGEFALGGSQASSITVPYTGSTPTYSGDAYPIELAQPGIFALTNFPASTPLMINIPNFNLSRGAGKQFLITNITYPTIITDGSGNATLRVGAELATDGDSSGYFDTGYNGSLNITISY
ncbi:MAG: DUF4402 domain-containing protein [Cellvibrionaceae bacterium]